MSNLLPKGASPSTQQVEALHQQLTRYRAVMEKALSALEMVEDKSWESLIGRDTVEALRTLLEEWE